MNIVEVGGFSAPGPRRGHLDSNQGSHPVPLGINRGTLIILPAGVGVGEHKEEKP